MCEDEKCLGFVFWEKAPKIREKPQNNPLLRAEEDTYVPLSESDPTPNPDFIEVMEMDVKPADLEDRIALISAQRNNAINQSTN